MSNSEALQQTRHAMVVPSLVVGMLSYSLDDLDPPVRPAELLDWVDRQPLTETIRRHLRESVIRRLRPRGKWLWQQPCGVRLAPGWQQYVSSDVKGAIEQALTQNSPRQFEELLVGEIKGAFKRPLAFVLEWLARLEALYWTSPAYPPHSAQNPQRQAVVAVDATAAVRASLGQALALPWVGKVAPDDIRFRFPGAPGGLATWLPSQVQDSQISGAALDLVEKLLRADDLTADEEVRWLIEAAGARCLPHRQLRAAQRWPEILRARYFGRETGGGLTLQEVGDAFGITRERVRQICTAYENVLRSGENATPALDRVFEAVARIAPCTVKEADTQIARFMGTGVGIEDLLGWAEALGRHDLPITLHKSRSYVRGEPIEVMMLERAGSEPWLHALVRHVARDCAMFGCTNILRIAGLLALNEGVAPGRAALAGALERAAGFRWLHEATGWFSLGDNEGCAAATRIRKIMAIARDHIGSDEIAAALASDDLWMLRDTASLAQATPPPHVLRELMRGWPWLRLIQKGRFMPSDSFDASDVLSESERAAVHVIESCDGVACRFELVDELERRLGIESISVSIMLGASPIFLRLEHGLYGLIGRRVGDSALNAARNRMRLRGATAAGSAHVDLASNEFIMQVTEAALLNEQYSVPSRFKPSLAGRRVAVWNPDSDCAGEARITQSGSIKGINATFEALHAGEMIRVRVESDRLMVWRHTAPRQDVAPPAAGPASPAQAPEGLVHSA